MTNIKNAKTQVVVSAGFVVVIVCAGIAYFSYNNKAQSDQSLTSKSPSRSHGSRNLSDMVNIVTIRGKITSVSDKLIIVDSADNHLEKIVQISNSTSIIRSVKANQNDIHTKSTVLIGCKRENNSVTAESISLVNSTQANPNSDNYQKSNKPMPEGRDMYRGIVDRIDTDKITITSLNQSKYTVTISKNTKFEKQESGEFSDIQNGKSIKAIGTIDSSGSIMAQNLTLLP